MLKRISIFILFLMVLSSCSPSSEAPQATTESETTTSQIAAPTNTPVSDDPFRILGIGSSLIENHGGMHTHLMGLAHSRLPSLPVESEIVQQGGASLSDLWSNFNSKKALQEGPWAVVVLQEIALKGPEFNGKYDKDDFFKYVRFFHEEIQKSGGETVLFMFWENDSMGIEEIATDHYQIASELAIKVAPVGLAWQKSLDQRPELELYFVDNIHASVHGNYLAAAVLYATIFEESPEGLTYVPDDVYGDVVISPNDLSYLQGIAWETVMENADR